jgi:hypothetical protein
MQETVELLIPFESLIECVEKLDMQEKIRLWEILDEQLFQAEEELLEQDPIIKSEIQEARNAYQAGDYITIDEYISKCRKSKGKELEIIEVKEGILLKPTNNKAKSIRGLLKGSKLTSERFMQLKQEEKELEK